jgi:serine-type D-Ala-D-Ala endopeptidase (penicillin-binding protein 7)
MFDCMPRLRPKQRFLHALVPCALAVLLGCLSTGPVAAAGPDPRLRSAAVLVLDRGTGTVLYERRADRAAPIASITKLMTALVVLDGGQPLEEALEITTEDRDRTEGNHSRLAVGTSLTRRALLRLALMSSENRAAQALGRSFPGGESAFVRAMNEKAAALGMTRSRFADPTGLSSGNVASPRDLVKLLTAAGSQRLISEFSTQPDEWILVGNQYLEFRNTNPLVRDPDWHVQVQKTGFINAAGRCLVMEAHIDGRPVVMVLLNSAGRLTRVADARRVREWIDPAEYPVEIVITASRDASAT